MESLPHKIERKKTLETLAIKEQWGFQVALHSKLGILEIFPESQELGIRGIDGKEYPVPEYEEIMRHLEAHREIIEQKMEQGFTKLILVPFGISLDVLRKKYEQSLLKHFKEGKLFATKKHPDEPDVPLDLDVNQPLYAWDGYNNADAENKMVYFPEEFSTNHRGKTKIELLDESGGWHMWLLEENPNIPREGKGETIGGRKQIEANKKPNEYIELLGTGDYTEEAGLTPEADIVHALTILEETDQVTNDYQGNGSLSYQIGAYFPSGGLVPCSYWDRGDRQAGLNGNAPSFGGSSLGARFGVRV